MLLLDRCLKLCNRNARSLKTAKNMILRSIPQTTLFQPLLVQPGISASHSRVLDILLQEYPHNNKYIYNLKSELFSILGSKVYCQRNVALQTHKSAVNFTTLLSATTNFTWIKGQENSARKYVSSPSFEFEIYW